MLLPPLAALAIRLSDMNVSLLVTRMGTYKAAWILRDLHAISSKFWFGPIFREPSMTRLHGMALRTISTDDREIELHAVSPPTPRRTIPHRHPRSPAAPPVRRPAPAPHHQPNPPKSHLAQALGARGGMSMSFLWSLLTRAWDWRQERVDPACRCANRRNVALVSPLPGKDTAWRQALWQGAQGCLARGDRG